MRNPRFWFKKNPKQPKEPEVPMSSLAERDPNEGYYISFPRDRAILALAHAGMMLDEDPAQWAEVEVVAALAGASVSWAVPKEADPNAYDEIDAQALFIWLRTVVLGSTA